MNSRCVLRPLKRKVSLDVTKRCMLLSKVVALKILEDHTSKWVIQERNQMQVCDEAKLKDLIKVVIVGLLMLPT